MPPQGSGRARRPAELQAHVPAGSSMRVPSTQPGSPCTDVDAPRAAGVLWRCEGRARGGNVGVRPPVPPQSCSALCSDVVDKADGSYLCTGLCEAVCLISRPCNNCCNSRCCGLQGSEIPCVRNVGLGFESWNFIWEHLSIRQKCITNQPANLNFSGFGCTCKGLMQLENTMCKWIPGTAGAGQKCGPEHRNELSFLQLICIFSGLEPFCTWCSRAQCFEMWPKLQSTVASLS